VYDIEATLGPVVRETVTIEVLMIHSPLVGPLTLAPLAAELRDRGCEVVLPDLRPALTAPRPQWEAIIDLICASVDSAEALVAHSGAGVLMPLVAEQLAPQITAFVDAVVPGDGAWYEASAAFVDFLESLPRDGALLPPWHEWWGAEAIGKLIPDDEMRRRIAADTPRVPRSFYDDPVPLPAGWTTRGGCCFLQLSPAYNDDRARAKEYGWPTAQMKGQHLDVAVRPGAIGDALTDLIDRTRAIW
jgi:hypothetical protein